MGSTAPPHDDAYGLPETGLELVATVEQVGFVVSEDEESPLTKPEYAAVIVGTVPP